MTRCIHPVAGLSLAALLALGALSGCAAPTAKLTSVSFKDIGLDSLTVCFDIEVTNPNATPLPLADVDYELSSSGNSFFTGEAQIAGEVPARGVKTISLPAKITYSQILLALANVKPGSVLPYTASLGVAIRAPVIGKFRLPASKEGKLPIPAAPGIELQRVKWDKLTLDHAGGTFTLRLTNRNQFPVELDAMAYTLTLGKMDVAQSSIARPLSLAAGGGTGDLEIPLSFSPRKFGLAALAMLVGDAKYSLAGSVRFKTPYGTMGIPLNKSGDIRLSR